MSTLEKRKGHCPTCGAGKHADTVALHEKRYDVEDVGVWGKTEYRILQCRGCEEIYFETTETFSEDVHYKKHPVTGEVEPYLQERKSYWPVPTKRDQPEWAQDLIGVDRPLSDLLDDVYGCLNAGLPVPAAIAVRTVFDRASELLDVDASLTFKVKLAELVAKGTVGQQEREMLSSLTDAGSAAAHRGWRPDNAKLGTMVSILETFLHRAFILPKQAQALSGAVPPLPSRKK